MAHSIGKVVVNKAIAMDKDDVKTIEKIKSKGIKFDIRKVPSDSKENIDNLLKKAKAELGNAQEEIIMSIITVILIIIVALLAGMEGVLDEFQFHTCQQGNYNN